MSRLNLGKLGAAALISLLPITAMADPVTLDVVAWKGNEAQPAGLPELIKKFETENPDIKVELTYVARKDVDKLMPPRLQGGNPPDVSMVDPSLVQLWGDAGFLSDLGQGSEWYSRLIPAVREIMSSGDKIFVMPLEVIGMGDFVNMGLLKKVGIDKAPVTVDETEAACKALSAAGITPMILPGGFSEMLWVGANAFNPNGVPLADLGSGKAKFADNADFNAALDSVRSLIDAGCFDPKLQAGLDVWSTALEEFKAGRVAMLPHGAWNIGSFSKIDGLDYQFAPMPSRFSNIGMALDLVGPGWAIPRDAKHPDAAKKWVEFFARDENLAVFEKAEGAYSTFVGGTNGVPELAAPYSAARAAGDLRLWPFSTLEFPKVLQTAWEEGLTGFLIHLDEPNKATLDRWDQAVEDNQ